ncbi:MAG: divalent metal cation transporter [Patescibacteria group bacterium]|jgi:Mn2+/Fe2+ NRAMP family transporter
MKKLPFFWTLFRRRVVLFFMVFGPATIAAMADNDASGVATYAIAGAKLGYPVLFILGIVTVLLGVTQEMGMRLTLVTRKGLGDHIREQKGVLLAVLFFVGLFIANMGTIIVNIAAFKTTASLLHLPAIPLVVILVLVVFVFVIKGDYKLTQNIMLLSCFLYFAYIFSAFKSQPNWFEAVSNLFFPHGAVLTGEYVRNYAVIGLGVLGTTITPWGQFFISSFAYDKKIDKAKLKYSQFETYVGAFLTDFFSFFMIVATAATLFVNKIPLVSGEQAAMAIKPFAGNLAAMLFAIGIMNAGFMGVVVVSLSTAYTFAEFFGLSGSLDTSFKESKGFYTIFIVQLLLASCIALLPFISLFKLAIASQIFNAMLMPFVFYFLIKFTDSKELMGEFTNHAWQRTIAIIGSVTISIVSVVVLIFSIFF